MLWRVSWEWRLDFRKFLPRGREDRRKFLLGSADDDGDLVGIKESEMKEGKSASARFLNFVQADKGGIFSFRWLGLTRDFLSLAKEYRKK